MVTISLCHSDATLLCCGHIAQRNTHQKKHIKLHFLQTYVWPPLRSSFQSPRGMPNVSYGHIAQTLTHTKQQISRWTCTFFCKKLTDHNSFWSHGWPLAYDILMPHCYGVGTLPKETHIKKQNKLHFLQTYVWPPLTDLHFNLICVASGCVGWLGTGCVSISISNSSTSFVFLVVVLVIWVTINFCNSVWADCPNNHTYQESDQFAPSSANTCMTLNLQPPLYMCGFGHNVPDPLWNTNMS